MSGRTVTWGVVGVLAVLFIYWQYTNYAHNNQLNADLGNPTSVQARVAAASELIDKKQFGDVLPTTLEPVHDLVIPALKEIARTSPPPKPAPPAPPSAAASASGSAKASADAQAAEDAKAAEPTDPAVDRGVEALKQLVGLMKDSDEKVRADAQKALIDLGKIAIPAVTDALGDGDAHAKKGAIAVLDAIGAPAIQPTIDAIKKDAPKRPAGIEALVNLAPAPTPKMLALLKDKDKDVRSTAANYFGNTALVPGRKQTQGEDLLLKLLQTDKDVRPAAMRAEGLLGDERALPEIEKALTAPADAGNRRVAVVALGDMRAISSVPQLIPFLDNPDPDIQSVTTIALHAMGPGAVPALAQAYASPDPAIRKGVAASVQAEISPDAIALLTRALHDPDPGVRQAAASSLGSRNNGAAVTPLMAALRDPSPDVAEAAVASLAEIGSPAVPALVSALGTPTPETAGGSSFSANGSSPNTTQTPPIVVPNYSSKALAAIGPPAADAVLAAAQSGSMPARRWALVTLQDLRTPRAVPVLQSIANGPDASLVPFARDALRHYQAT